MPRSEPPPNTPTLLDEVEAGAYVCKLPIPDENDPDWVAKRQAHARESYKLEQAFRVRALNFVGLRPGSTEAQALYSQAWERGRSGGYPAVLRALLDLAGERKGRS